MASLTSEEIELKRYSGHLDGAYKAGIKEGIAKGIGQGMLFTSFYLSYALAFWYGTKQVGFALVTPLLSLFSHSYIILRFENVTMGPSFCKGRPRLLCRVVFEGWSCIHLHFVGVHQCVQIWHRSALYVFSCRHPRVIFWVGGLRWAASRAPQCTKHL